MAGVFAKDPNMEWNGQAELDRVHPCGFGLKVPAATVELALAAIKTIVVSAWALEDNSIHAP